ERHVTDARMGSDVVSRAAGNARRGVDRHWSFLDAAPAYEEFRSAGLLCQDKPQIVAGSRRFMSARAGAEIVAARHRSVARRGAHVARFCAGAVRRNPHALSRAESAYVLLGAGAYFNQSFRRKRLGVAIAVGGIWSGQRLGALSVGPPFDWGARSADGLRLDGRLLSPRLVFAKRARLHGVALLYVAGHVVVAGIARS